MTDGVRGGLPAEIDRLRRLALFLCRDQTDADELLQETLTLAISKAATWQPDRPLRPWLIAIMHNCFISSQRRFERRARAAAMLEALTPLQADAPQVEQVELTETLRAVRQLPPYQREVLVLVGVEDMTYEEVAVLLDIPIGTVMSRLYRARETLREITARTTHRSLKVLK